MLREFGLDQPLPVQYLLWIGNMLQGNFGWSFRTGQPVAALIVVAAADHDRAGPARGPERRLRGASRSAWRPASRGASACGRWSRSSGVLGLSLPNFWIAILLIIGASSLFGWLPALIYVTPWADPWVNLQQMFLPVLSLALGLSAVVVRMTRSSMLEVLGQDFIRVARAKGLSDAGGPPAPRAPERARSRSSRSSGSRRASSWAAW